MIEIRKEGKPYTHTVDVCSLRDAPVYSKYGAVLGKIETIRFEVEKNMLAGIILISDETSEPIYVSAEYIQQINDEEIILNTNIAELLQGKQVVTDTKRIGTVKKVISDPFIKIKTENRIIPAKKIKRIAEKIHLRG